MAQNDNNINIDELNEEDVSTLESVGKDLAELLTNSVNMADRLFEIFFDPNPHLVPLQLYDSEGNLTTYEIPNRAMDRSVAKSGNGSPEGVVEGVIGTLYIDESTRDLYIKKTEKGTSGWVNITPQSLNIEREEFDIDSNTTYVRLRNTPYDKEYVDVYVNGEHISNDDFDISSDGYTLEFYTPFLDNSKMQVVYYDGIYGLKGETALTVRVGDVITVDTNTPANVENVGTNQDIILDFTIPKGETGDSGVWVSPEKPTIEDKNIWIDTSATGLSSNELGAMRIFDSKNNTNSLAYDKAFSLMHSGIDYQKFVSFGDIHIDDNGYLTMYNANSGLRTSVTVSQIKNENWSVEGQDYIDVNKGDIQYFFSIGNSENAGCSFYFETATKSFCYENRTVDSKEILFNNNADIYDINGAGWYNWKVEYKEGEYFFYISFNQDPLTLKLRITSSNVSSDDQNFINIGAESDNYSKMISNLPLFNIKINSKLEWTPNPTGVEYIIDDNYNLIGHPVINPDGILTQVQNGNSFIYGETKAQILQDQDWAIIGHFKHIGQSEVLCQFADPNYIESAPFEEYMQAGDYQMCGVAIDATDNKLKFYLRAGDLNLYSNQQIFEFDIVLNESYYFKYEFDYSEGTYKFSICKNPYFETEVEYKTYFATTTKKSPIVAYEHPNYQFIIGSNNTKEDNQISVYNNLNYYKILTKGKTVFQATLRIPCTYTKYGVKFTYPENQYLVEDAYEIYGKGNLFILDDVARAVTLPLNDIYSLIENEHSTRPKYGKGLSYDSKTNTVENLTQGLDIGDITETPYVDESVGTRVPLNGQLITITPELQPFFEFVQKLRDKGLIVTEEEWQVEAEGNNGDCNKFVINSETVEELVNYYAFIPEQFVIRTPIGETEEVEITISPELAEQDIIYSNSLELNDTVRLFKKINNIIYPEYNIAIADIYNEELYYHYTELDFNRTITTEVANYVRIPKRTSTNEGYQYFIQVATGVSNSVDIHNDYQSVSPYVFGMYQYSDVDLNSAGWLISQGQWNEGKIYPSYYDWIKTNADNKVDKFKKWNNPEYSVTVNDFVIDEENLTFRLPLVANIMDYTLKRFLVSKKEPTDTDHYWYNLYSDGWLEQGNWFITAGSTDGSAQTKTIVFQIPYLTNAYTVSVSSQVGGSGWQYSNGADIVNLTPTQFQSRMATGVNNSILSWRTAGYTAVPDIETIANGASKLYYYVGDTIKNPSLIDSGFALNEIAKLSSMSILTAPKGEYKDLGNPATNTTITMEDDGWLCMKKAATAANQYLGMYDDNTGLGELHYIPIVNNWAQVCIPVYKGAVIRLFYNAGTHNFLRFIPTQKGNIKS